MILVDTGAWFAAFIPEDPDYAAASGWLESNEQPLITTDYIIDETLTLMRARRQRQRAVRIGAQFFAGELAKVHRITEDEFRRAWDVFRAFTDKDWSFTDCTSKVVMEVLGITTAFSFDQHFRQFGTVTVVP